MTRARDTRPTVRVVHHRAEGELVAAVGAGVVVLRPLHARRGSPDEVVISWGQIYDHAVSLRHLRAPARRSRRVPVAAAVARAAVARAAEVGR